MWFCGRRRRCGGEKWELRDLPPARVARDRSPRAPSSAAAWQGGALHPARQRIARSTAAARAAREAGSTDAIVVGIVGSVGSGKSTFAQVLKLLLRALLGIGAAGLADGTCDTMTFAEATAAGATFFGHGTDCTQPIPSIDSSAFYDGGSLAYGQFSDTVDVAAVTLSNPPAIIRQPIDEEIRSISRLSVAGALRAVATSNTNVGSGRSGHGLASFTTDLLITMTFRDGSAPLSVVRTPMVGGITNSSPQGLVQNMVVENVHLDDGREIESVSVRVNFNGPGIPSDSWVLLAGNSIDDTEPSSGALVSPNGGQSWYPMLAADGRRVQLVLSIEP